MNSFRQTVTDHGEHALLTLVGDLDFAAHADLEAQVVALAEAGRPVVVDCAGITFLDSMGLRALLAGLLAAQKAGQAFILAAPSPPVLRVLELSGTRERFRVRDHDSDQPLERALDQPQE
jgi:anti-anti-sigma factor